MRMLAKDPEARYPRLSEAATELNRFNHIHDAKAGNQQVADFLKTVFNSALEDRAKAFLSDAGKFMKTPSQGTASFKMAGRSATGAPTPTNPSMSLSGAYAGASQGSQTAQRPVGKKTNPLTLVLAGALGHLISHCSAALASSFTKWDKTNRPNLLRPMRPNPRWWKVPGIPKCGQIANPAP